MGGGGKGVLSLVGLGVVGLVELCLGVEIEVVKHSVYCYLLLKNAFIYTPPI